MATKYPSIPIPSANIASMYQAISAMRQTINLLTINQNKPGASNLSQSSQVFATTDQLQNSKMSGPSGPPGPIGPAGPQGPQGIPGSGSSYTLPQASTTVLGGVKVDGTTIAISSGGVISSSSSGGIADAPNDATLYARKSLAWSHITHNDITDWATFVPPPYILPQASTTVLGGVKVDGTTVTINSGTGVISAAGGASITVSDTAPTLTNGAMWFDSIGTQLYIGYNDGTSSQWVQANNIPLVVSPAVPVIVAPPVSASWTKQNFGTATTLNDVANGLQLYDTGSASTGNQARGVYRVAPSAPYVIDANFSVIGLLAAASGNYLVPSIGWTDGTKIQSLCVYFLTGTVNNTITIRTLATPTTAAGTVGTVYLSSFNLSNFWLRMADDGTNVSGFVSHDGVNWLLAYTVAKASGYLGASGYTNVGWFFEAGYLGVNSFGSVALKSWYIH